MNKRNPAALAAASVLKSAMALLCCALAVLLYSLPLHAAPGGTGFDHLSTGFPLDGAHADTECSLCHVRGIFKGTPSECGLCHGQGSRMSGTTKPADHIQTLNMCGDCHSERVWTPLVRFNHDDVIGSCASCHNGTTAEGKTPNHIASGNSCDDCHTTNAWTPAVFDHSSVTGSCTNCHNGSAAEGKNATHIQTSAQCDECHSTIAWIPASFNHDQVSGSCSSCHNGSTATGKPSSHFITGLQCDECHTTNRWVPLDFRHSSAAYPGDHRANPACNACHGGNSQTVTWSAPAYRPDCAACHASDYKPGEHDNQSVSENRDCASSSCHEDSPRHSVFDSDWET